MEFFLFAFIVALIGAAPYDVGANNWVEKWVGLSVFYFVISLGLAYLTMPALIGPMWGAPLGIALLLAAGFNVGITAFIADSHRHRSREVMKPYGLYAVLILFVLMCVFAFSGSSCLRSSDYHSFVEAQLEDRDWEKDMVQIDTVHIRMVSEEQATWKANKVLGQVDGSLGSRYKVGQMRIQRTKDALVWVGPLEFLGFKTWQANDSTPGYVLVSAEDPNDEGVLVTGYELKYLSSAWLNNKLERIVYLNGYQFRGLDDWTFEIDDDGKPFYVVSLFHPKISYWGPVIEGVLIVDPTDGTMTEYSMEELLELVDRVIPRDVARSRLSWHGKFVDGWLNSWWGEIDVNVPTTSESMPGMWLTWGDDGQAYWFTGLTSSKTTDQSLVGFALVNTRTGDVRKYRLSGSDELGIQQAVNAAVSNYDGWHATQPILYNVYGELTWIVPVISSEGIFQEIALVHAGTAKVAHKSDKRSALAEYRSILRSSGNGDAPSSLAGMEQLTGTVSRFNCLNDTCYLMLSGDTKQRVFSGSVQAGYELPVTLRGDRVHVSFMETTETPVQIVDFRIAGLETPVSDVQNRADDIQNDQAEREYRELRIREARDQIGQMSDEDVLLLLGTPATGVVITPDQGM